jgi:hypothetical protein
MIETNWKKIALDSVPDPQQHVTIVGGIVVAVAIAGTTTIASGGFFLILSFLYAYRRGEKSVKFDEAIEQGLIAHALSADNLNDYVQAVGIEKAIEEIKWAEANGYPTSDSAIELLESMPESVEATQPALIFPSDPIPAALSLPSVKPTAVVNPPASNPQPPIPLPSKSSPPPEITEIYTPKSQQPFDLLDAASEKIKHTLLLGISGGGKGYFAASVLRKIKERHDVSIVLIDPKADPDESGYFEGVVDRLHRGVMDRMSLSESIEFIKAGLEIFDEECDHWGKSKRCLLVLDEGSEIGKLLSLANDKDIKRKLSGLLTGGDSRGRNLWVIGQNPFCDDLGLNLGAATQMRRIIILREEDVVQTKPWKRAALMDGVNTLDAFPQIKLSPIPTGRAIYWNDTDTWYPMPILPNYSTYDRDNRDFVVSAAESLDLITESVDSAPNQPIQPIQHQITQLDSAPIQPIQPQISELAEAILEYFSLATVHEPKKLSNLKASARIKKMATNDPDIIAALILMVEEEKLHSPMAGYWSLPDWSQK